MDTTYKHRLLLHIVVSKNIKFYASISTCLGVLVLKPCNYLGKQIKFRTYKSKQL